MKMPFGKHKGAQLKDIPRDYLLWVFDNCERISERLRKAICIELGIDPYDEIEEEDVYPSSDRETNISGSVIIDQVYREMAKRFHPDRGGSVPEMQAVNEVIDRFRQLFNCS